MLLQYVYPQHGAASKPKGQHMSSFLCSEKHINTIVVWALQNNLLDPAEAVSTAGGLFDCNCAAMQALYVDRTWRDPNEDVRAELDEARAMHADTPSADQLCEMACIARGPAITHAQAHTLLECLYYQCCEGDVSETHAAMPWLKATLAEAKRLAGGATDEHYWGI